MNLPERSKRTLAVANDGAAWRLSPLLPLEMNRDRQFSLLSILAVAHSQQIPLVPLLKAFAVEHRFWFRRALFHLARRMEAGESLSVALMRTPGLLPQGTVLAIHSARTDDALTRAFSTLLHANEQHANANGIRVMATVVYWIWFSVPAVVITSGIAFFILPTFKRMFDEFELNLSPPVKLIISLIGTLTLPCLLTIQIVGLFLFLYWLTPLRIVCKSWFYRWNVGFSRNRYRTELLMGTAAAVGSGAELNAHFLEVQSHCENRTLRKKAAAVVKLIAAGISPWVALGKAGFVTEREAVALDAMQSDSMRSWALLRMTQRDTDTMRNQRNTLFTVLHPLVICLFGLFVLCVCFATFEPLTALIHALS